MDAGPGHRSGRHGRCGHHGRVRPPKVGQTIPLALNGRWLAVGREPSGPDITVVWVVDGQHPSRINSAAAAAPAGRIDPAVVAILIGQHGRHGQSDRWSVWHINDSRPVQAAGHHPGYAAAAAWWARHRQPALPA